MGGGGAACLSCAGPHHSPSSRIQKMWVSGPHFDEATIPLQAQRRSLGGSGPSDHLTVATANDARYSLLMMKRTSHDAAVAVCSVSRFWEGKGCTST